ncbi:hypothetical protein KFL_002420040 [Klebsormidium nitens]|uniref:Disease resistance R13L4/SHOC-2-like LRR domain-containing protein n=1 Tax=Klebsormidium nitens TaxID=105231 RepID=A0A1Y1I8V7_KLENI|nr:hypothetical protein KFL_002420040 [Klebsormidium nitens]|eukprot:GAQ85571.1 hypothetical protein KFL_002420040 [Klebsormidium nitens]
MGCCASSPAALEGAKDPAHTRAKPPDKELQVLKIKKEDAKRREQHWKVTGIVGLRSNNLKALPKAVLDLGPHVRTLDASDNKIGKLPPTIGMLTQLTRLILQQNQLTVLPPEIGQLVQLRVLQVDRNQLSALPDEVGLLQKLEKLTAAGNKMTSLPVAVGQLKALVELDVSKNRLTSLPPSLSGCASLQELRAPANELSALPDELSDATELRTLDLDGNPLSKLPSDLLRGCGKLHTLSAHGTSIRVEDLEKLEGYAAFEARRQGKYTKQLAGNAMGSKRGFDEGVDRDLYKFPGSR